MFSPSFVRRFSIRLAPYLASAAAFVRALRRADSSVPLLRSLQAEIRDLQADVDRLQSQTQSNARPVWQKAVDSAPAAIVIYDSGRTVCNPAALAFLGIGAQEAEFEFPPNLLRYPSGQSVPPGALPWTRAAQTQLPQDFTPYLLAPADVPFIPIEIAARPTPDGAVAVLRDVSEIRRAQESDVEARRISCLLAEAARQMSRAADLAILSQITVDAALALLPPNCRPNARALLCTFDGQNQPLVMRAIAPIPEKKRPRRHADTLPHTFVFDAQSPLLWKVYLDRQTVVIDLVDSDPLFAEPRERALLYAPPGPIPVITSLLMLPLLPGAAAIGHLLLTSPLPGAFAPDTRNALALLSALSASALAHAQSDTLRCRQDDQVSALHRAASLVPGNLFPDTLAQCAAAALGAAAGALFLADVPLPSGPHSSDLQSWGTSVSVLSASIVDGGPTAPRCACIRAVSTAIRRGEPHQQIGIPNPPLGECAWRAFGGQSGAHSVLAVPLRLGETVRGALAIYRHGSQPFTSMEINLAEIFAALALRAIPE